MLRFENIDNFYLLLIIPIILILLFYHKKWRERAIISFGEKRLVHKLIESYSESKENFKNLIIIITIIFLTLALVNPQIGTKMEEVKKEGVDLMIAIDLSNSMLAEDIKPNRLESAKQSISKLIDKLENDRIGLVVFAGEAYVQLPITSDFSAAKLFLSTINTHIITSQGTEIAKAIDLCMQSFDFNNGQEKAIIIITDGENHDEKAIESAKKADEAGVFIHTLGMGLSKGVPIPSYNKDIKIPDDYRKDNKGNVVITKINEKLLKEIAKSSKGVYINANNSRTTLDKILEELNKMERKKIGTMIFIQHKDRFQLFISLALVLLFLDLLISNKKNNFLRNILKRKT